MCANNHPFVVADIPVRLKRSARPTLGRLALIALAALALQPPGLTAAPLEVTCPPAITIACGAPVPSAATSRTLFTDIGGTIVSDAPVTVSSVDGPLTPGAIGATITRTYTVEDDAMQSVPCAQIITVIDSVTPEIQTCASNITVNADADCKAVVPNLVAEVGASDACSVVTIIQSPAAGTMVGLGDHPVTITITDESGNATNCVAVVSVTDVTPPMITCPDNQTVECAGVDGATATFTASAVDACDANPTVACVPASGGAFALGVTTVTCTATDAGGN